MYVIHVSGLYDDHGSNVFSSLKEMPAVRRFGSQEAREIERVIRICKNQEVFLRPLFHFLLCYGCALSGLRASRPAIRRPAESGRRHLQSVLRAQKAWPCIFESLPIAPAADR